MQLNFAKLHLNEYNLENFSFPQGLWHHTIRNLIQKSEQAKKLHSLLPISITLQCKSLKIQLDSITFFIWNWHEFWLDFAAGSSYVDKHL